MGSSYNSVVIDAPVDRVWFVVRDFHHMEWAGPFVMRLEKVGKLGGTEVGAQRVINGLLHETLLSLDDNKRELSYRINDGPGPISREFVSKYVARVRVLPVTVTNQTYVEYTSTFEAKDEAAVDDLVNPIFTEVLGYLAKHFAGK
jgi:hypothetical protein